MTAKKPDWLGAAAESAKGLPGGRFLLGGLTKLRDDKKAQERNNAIDEVLARGSELTTEVLRKAVSIEDDTRDVKALLELLVPVITDTVLGKDLSEFVFRKKLEVSGFPLPLRPGLLMEELDAIFGNDTSELENCCDINDFRVEATSRRIYIRTMVDNMSGQNLGMLAELFACIHKKRPSSVIIGFSADYLRDKQGQAGKSRN